MQRVRREVYLDPGTSMHSRYAAGDCGACRLKPSPRFHTKMTLAGLGIGGLAIALVTEKTLDNLIGGIALLMDKAVHVGDFCQIGGRIGAVEDIGLRSLEAEHFRPESAAGSQRVACANGVQNLAARKKLLMNQTFSLRIQTQVEQLRFWLHRVQTMLDEHPDIETSTWSIRVANFAGAVFALQLFAYGQQATLRNSPQFART